MRSHQKIKADTYEFHLDDRGFYNLKLMTGASFSIKNVSDIRNHIELNCKAGKRPFLIELSYGALMSEEVQSHLSKGEDSYSIADAFLISTFAHKTLTNHYLRFFKPKTETKVFNDVFEALDWIELKKGQG